jgi:hypothetical protein
VRSVVVFAVLGACQPAPPPPVTPTYAVPAFLAKPRVSPHAATPRRDVSRLTPIELGGAVLGQTRDELVRARPAVVLDANEHYEFREHYLETVDAMLVHYYVLRDGSAMYQISVDYPDADAAEAAWSRFGGMGQQIDDLGGKEIVIEGYPFQIRAWTHGRRLQIMAVIEGSEWWDQYHKPGADDDGDGDGGKITF